MVAADGAQLGHLSKEGACGHIAYAGNRLQKRLGLAPNRRGLDRLADVAVDLGELFLQEECRRRRRKVRPYPTLRNVGSGRTKRSVPGLQAQGGRGLTPTFSLAGFPAGNSDIQGGPSRDTASSREREGLLGAENLVDGHSNTFPDWKKTCIPAKGRERQAREQVRNAAA